MFVQRNTQTHCDVCACTNVCTIYMFVHCTHLHIYIVCTMQCVCLFVHCTHCTKCTKCTVHKVCICVCTICMFVHCTHLHIYIINHPTNRLQQKEATIQHQQNASTMQLLQIQNGVIYANGIRKFVRKTPLERWYL